jgi:hypothetical protein
VTFAALEVPAGIADEDEAVPADSKVGYGRKTGENMLSPRFTAHVEGFG